MTDNSDFYDVLRNRIGPRKHCTACNSDHPIEDFPIKNRAQFRLHARCKQAQRVLAKKNYAANQDKRRTAVAGYRARLRFDINGVVDAWLAERLCERCSNPGKHLIAVDVDGENIRARQANGFNVDDIKQLLADAHAECWGCRSHPDPGRA